MSKIAQILFLFVLTVTLTACNSVPRGRDCLTDAPAVKASFTRIDTALGDLRVAAKKASPDRVQLYNKVRELINEVRQAQQEIDTIYETHGCPVPPMTSICHKEAQIADSVDLIADLLKEDAGLLNNQLVDAAKNNRSEQVGPLSTMVAGSNTLAREFPQTSEIYRARSKECD